jgi:hypothetical protein
MGHSYSGRSSGNDPNFLFNAPVLTASGGIGLTWMAQSPQPDFWYLMWCATSGGTYTIERSVPGGQYSSSGQVAEGYIKVQGMRANGQPYTQLSNSVQITGLPGTVTIGWNGTKLYWTAPQYLPSIWGVYDETTAGFTDFIPGIFVLETPPTPGHTYHLVGMDSGQFPTTAPSNSVVT